MSNLKLNDKVNWKGNYGKASEIEATVTGINLNVSTQVSVKEIPWALVTDRNVIITLSNGQWAYAYQISKK